jgi:CheY-like chemotaxis protein
VIERATEPFFTTKGVGKGTGLGLAMASGFMQQSRGRLEIESEPGQGTLIRMLFPIAGEDAQAAPKPASRAVEAPDAAEGGQSARILVVEDSPEVLALAREVLEGVGYQVTTAETGEEGLRTFQAAGPDAFDLLFTDLVMPGGINGIVLAQEVAKLSPGMPVLMTTGYNEELVMDTQARPGLDVLGKPYRRTELLDRVRQALSQAGKTGERRRVSDFGSVEE